MDTLKNLSILKKLIAAFLVIVSVSVLSNLVVWQNKNSIEDSSAWTDHTYRVLALMQRVMAAMVDQETGVRGFLVSGDEKFLDPYKSGQTDFENAFREVKRLTSDNPTQQGRLDQVQRLAQTWRNDIAAKEIELMRQPNTREEARAMEASGAGKASMDGIRALVAQISAAEDVLLVKRAADRAAAYENVRLAILAGTGFGIFLCGLMAFLLTKGVSAPVVEMTATMHKLASRDLSVAVPSKDRKDEIGAMAAAVQVFKDNMLKADELEAAAARERATREARAAKVLKLTQDFDAAARQVVGTLSSSAEALQSSASTMTQTAEATSQQATAVAAASEQASTNVQTVASSAEELSASIQEISRRVAESATISKSAVDQADRTTATVQSLVAVAAKIGDVTKLINGIASQTNLLALNATIEAARAGEAGKGFAVVASEVKGLASQTSRATDEISEQIAAIQKASADTVKAIGEIATTIRTINEIAAAIAAAVEEQGAATQEIARNVQQASAGTSEVSSNIAGVTKAAADTGHVAGQVRSGASEIADQATLLKREVDGFLDGVRAA